MKGRNDLVQLYEDLREIVIHKRECRDITDMWLHMIHNHHLMLVEMLDEHVDLVDSFSPERLYMRTLCHMQRELGKEYLATTTQHSEGSIFDSENETVSTSGTDGEITRSTSLQNFELRVGFDSSSDETSSAESFVENEEIIYANLDEFKE